MTSWQETTIRVVTTAVIIVHKLFVDVLRSFNGIIARHRQQLEQSHTSFLFSKWIFTNEWKTGNVPLTWQHYYYFLANYDCRVQMLPNWSARTISVIGTVLSSLLRAGSCVATAELKAHSWETPHCHFMWNLRWKYILDIIRKCFWNYMFTLFNILGLYHS